MFVILNKMFVISNMMIVILNKLVLNLWIKCRNFELNEIWHEMFVLLNEMLLI